MGDTERNYCDACIRCRIGLVCLSACRSVLEEVIGSLSFFILINDDKYRVRWIVEMGFYLGLIFDSGWQGAGVTAFGEDLGWRAFLLEWMRVWGWVISLV